MPHTRRRILRPCGECRRARFVAFKQAWLKGVEVREGGTLRVTKIDPVMHADRLAGKGVQRRFVASLSELPEGVMVQLPTEFGVARLKWRGRLLRWTPARYSDALVLEGPSEVSVLTPACTVKVLAAGYVPEVHPSMG